MINKYIFFIGLFLFLLTNCKSDTEKFDNNIKDKIYLDKNQKLTYFERVESDSLSLKEIDNFISNAAYQNLIHLNKEQHKIGSEITKIDTAKTIEGVRKFQEEFKRKLKQISDSTQYYSKIVDATIDSKKSDKKIVKIIKYKYIIKNQDTKAIKELETTVFIDGNNIFLHPEAFFRYQIKSIIHKKQMY